jgi:Zn-dependent peptidase ImmA (M78 family)
MTTWERFYKQLGYESEKAMWEEMYTQYTMKELADQFNVSVGLVRNRLLYAGITPRKRGGPQSSLVDFGMSDELVLRIKTEGLAAIAKELGLSKYAVMTRRKKFLRSKGEGAKSPSAEVPETAADPLSPPLLPGDPPETGD